MNNLKFSKFSHVICLPARHRFAQAIAGGFAVLFICLFIAVPRVMACDVNIACEGVADKPDTLKSCNSNEVQIILSKCTEAFSNMEKAAQPHRAELDKMNRAIAAFQARIVQIELDVVKKTAEIAAGEKELEGSLRLASERIRQFYKRSYTSNFMYLFLSSDSIGSVLRTLGYQQAAVNEDKKVITETALLVKGLEDKKTSLEGEKSSLAALKSDTDRRAESVRKLLSQVAAYEGTLKSAIAAISARQQEFLNQKLAGLGIPLYAMSGGGCSSDLTNGKSPSFSGGFGFFSFGVPNRVGLNQYGAFGRAKAGQNADTILNAYYSFNGYKSAGDITIRVNDSNEYDRGNIIWTGSLNDYIKRIYEVPNDWPYESIKAQVIAARSYVVAATNNGASSICANQYCQVFQQNEKGGAWGQAVNDTGTDVMQKDGQVIKAYFSSTHGGYAYNTGDLNGWSQTNYTKRMVDTSSGSVSSFSELRNNAYDKDSPWFYCDWGGRSAEGGTAWLRPEEVADIVNVVLLVQRDSSLGCFVFQPDKSPPAPGKGCPSTGNWSPDKVRQELSSRGGTPFNTINNISVSVDFGSGMTTNINFSGDKGSVNFSANDYKNYFNQRAPSNIQIVGPLFNVEKR